MATYTIGVDDFAVHGKKLVANVVDSVTFARDVDGVEIISDGTGEIYYSVDGSTPTIGGTRCYRMPATGSVLTDLRSLATRVDVIKLISSGTPTYSIQRS